MTAHVFIEGPEGTERVPVTGFQANDFDRDSFLLRYASEEQEFDLREYRKANEACRRRGVRPLTEEDLREEL
jgi:hypothetical protein